jgi:hypothetical protein
MSALTQEEAHRLFEYKDGVLFWKIRSARCVNVGDVVGGTNGKNQPYLRTRIKNQGLLVHRIVFLMHHGYMPEVVDHIDNNIQNNRIENLRAATKSQNHQNAAAHKNNTSGCKNVFWHKSSGCWQVKLRSNGKIRHVGSFQDLELADLVAHEARNLYHGNFANHF